MFRRRDHYAHLDRGAAIETQRGAGDRAMTIDRAIAEISSYIVDRKSLLPRRPTELFLLNRDDMKLAQQLVKSSQGTLSDV